MSDIDDLTALVEQIHKAADVINRRYWGERATEMRSIRRRLEAIAGEVHDSIQPPVGLTGSSTFTVELRRPTEMPWDRPIILARAQGVTGGPLSIPMNRPGEEMIGPYEIVVTHP